MSETFPTTKVGPSTSRACERCRRQKLKCDVEKPCFLCRRAGLVCQGASDLVWKTTRVGNPTAKRAARKLTKGRKRKPNQEKEGIAMNFEIGDREVKEEENTSDKYPDSSTLHLLKEMFNFHQRNDLAQIDTSSLPRGEHLNAEEALTVVPQDPYRTRASFRAVAPRAAKRRSRTVEELLDVLPKPDSATQLLVDTYFDRVHWFMLVFYQGSFRSRFSDLMILTADSDSDFSFASGSSAIKAIGLFDLIAIGDLESVQACVLVGHFYLFHGCPGSALPVISCGTRIAQGMGLGRRKMKEWGGAEKRVWMAIFEIDRFCSMVYGLPISFTNEDFHIYDLVSCPPSMGPGDYCPKNSRQNPSTLLFYKTHMADLSMILTDVLRELYTHSPSQPSRNYRTSEATTCTDSEIQILSRKINVLDQKLRNWYANVHPVLQLLTTESKTKAYETPIMMANDIAGNGECFDRHILLMQAITLKFAFENAIIMTHRPLLSFRSAQTIQSESNPCKTSIAGCRIAALNTAAIGSWDVFEETLDTYAASFIGIHVFTAGVVLCLITSFEPQANEVKEGLQNLMEMQKKLKSKSVVASQGLEILEKLMGIVVEKESGEKEKHEVNQSRDDGNTDLIQSPAYSDFVNTNNQISLDGIYSNVSATDMEQGWIWDPDWLVNI